MENEMDQELNIFQAEIDWMEIGLKIEKLDLQNIFVPMVEL